jgi:hypothetical protein
MACLQNIKLMACLQNIKWVMTGWLWIMKLWVISVLTVRTDRKIPWITSVRSADLLALIYVIYHIIQWQFLYPLAVQIWMDRWMTIISAVDILNMSANHHNVTLRKKLGVFPRSSPSYNRKPMKPCNTYSDDIHTDHCPVLLIIQKNTVQIWILLTWH